ncbi:hypothetical protein [Streptomyces cyaneofuscatus]|uniref:hypothetical protein n=1 Tax=Streptomyces cyaneofuscatus TaxID=66883 RepID=UPI003668C300
MNSICSALRLSVVAAAWRRSSTRSAERWVARWPSAVRPPPSAPPASETTDVHISAATV